jgi:hypothetical protein
VSIRKTLVIGATALMLAPLVGCGSNNGYDDVAICQNRTTGEVLPDSACAGYSGGAFPDWLAYMYVTQAIYSTHANLFTPGYHMNSTQINNYHVTYNPPPGNAKVATRDGTVRKATVYKAKQAGQPVKYNQDAKKISSLTKTTQKGQKQGNSQSLRINSSKSYSSQRAGERSSYKPSYGTPPRTSTRTGRCC